MMIREVLVARVRNGNHIGNGFAAKKAKTRILIMTKLTFVKQRKNNILAL